eukprot:764215-Hanusia_phi.AAC.1
MESPGEYKPPVTGLVFVSLREVAALRVTRPHLFDVVLIRGSPEFIATLYKAEGSSASSEVKPESPRTSLSQVVSSAISSQEAVRLLILLPDPCSISPSHRPPLFLPVPCCTLTRALQEPGGDDESSFGTRGLARQLRSLTTAVGQRRAHAPQAGAGGIEDNE